MKLMKSTLEKFREYTHLFFRLKVIKVFTDLKTGQFSLCQVNSILVLKCLRRMYVCGPWDWRGSIPSVTWEKNEGGIFSLGENGGILSNVPTTISQV